PAAQPSAAPLSETPTVAAETTVPTAAATAPAALATDAQPLKVVATYSILADFIQNVAGDKVALTTLVGPGGDAHTYEPTPRDSAALAEADILFENGLLFESWIDDLYSASNSKATRVAVSAQITPLAAVEEHGHEEDPLAHPCKHFAASPEQVAAGGAIPDDHTHYALALSAGAGNVTLTRDADAEVSFYLSADVPFAITTGGSAVAPETTQKVSEGCDAIAMVYTFDLAPGDYTLSFGPGAGDTIALVWEVGATHGEAEHAHQHGEFDPHIWHDPANAILMVEAVRDALVSADAANAATYTANAEAYLAQIRDLDTWIKAEVAKLPAERRKLVTTHDTFGYFAKAYGFEIVGTALGVTTEASDPSAGEIAALVESIRAAGVPAIFTENIVSPSLMEALSSEAGVTLAPTLYTDALGEPGSAGATYLEMMRYNVTTIVTALAG
ncbi:MAG: zinc ABC transporter solute-binding protein, partial [Oscillochloris sp.]|nr:zinc ABC transporter solute-binding protein [Oscillochloris sp.]